MSLRKTEVMFRDLNLGGVKNYWIKRKLQNGKG